MNRRAVCILASIAVLIVIQASDQSSSQLKRAAPIQWNPTRLVALVHALRVHQVWNPDAKKHGDMQKIYTAILKEEPWLSMGVTNWRPLYNKGLEIAKDYSTAIENEKYHTGGGQPKRPEWWKECEKDLAILAEVHGWVFFFL
jgi:hypothetical protein